MKKQSAEMAARIERALKSGKLKLDGSYTIPTLAAIIGTTRAELRQAVNREFGSVAAFCTHLGFGLKTIETATATS
jgi:hypothetical protein